MSGRGERPGRDGDGETGQTDESAVLGEHVFDSDGQLLGKVRGYESGGFFVSTRPGIERLSIEHARSGHYFGEAHLMWRCITCGEMGELDRGTPTVCPNCGAAKEEIMWWTED